MSINYTSPEYTHCIRDARFRSNVYEPEADTFLFLEALDKDADFLRQLNLRRCIEIGCGSGTVITHLRCLLALSLPSSSITAENSTEEKSMEHPTAATVSTADGGPLFCAVDLNPLALEATGITWTDTLLKHFASPILTDHFSKRFNCVLPESLAAPMDVVTFSEKRSTEAEAKNLSSPSPPAPAQSMATSSTTVAGASSGLLRISSSTYFLRRFEGDLFDPVRNAFAEKDAVFDVILFNPPYVPTSLEELEDAVAKKDVITAAWCGGPRGRVVLDRFLQQLPLVMSRHGACYIVLIKENEVQDVIDFSQRTFRAHLLQMHVEVAEGDVLEATEVAARYTGEHLSVYRLRYLPQYRGAST